MDVSELWALTEGHLMPLSEKEAIFRALVGFPHAEAICGADAEDLADALDAACNALHDDLNGLPRATLDLVLEQIAPTKAAATRTYADAALIVSARPAPWRARFLIDLRHRGGNG